MFTEVCVITIHTEIHTGTRTDSFAFFIFFFFFFFFFLDFFRFFPAPFALFLFDVVKDVSGSSSNCSMSTNTCSAPTRFCTNLMKFILFRKSSPLFFARPNLNFLSTFSTVWSETKPLKCVRNTYKCVTSMYNVPSMLCKRTKYIKSINVVIKYWSMLQVC